MRPCRILLCLAILTAGCSDPVRDARAKFDIVRHSAASTAEICARARAIPEAYLEKGDQEGYREATVEANIYCDNAKLQDEVGVDRDLDSNAETPTTSAPR